MNYAELIAIIEGIKNGLYHAKKSGNFVLAAQLQSSLAYHEDMLIDEEDEEPPEMH